MIVDCYSNSHTVIQLYWKYTYWYILSLIGWPRFWASRASPKRHLPRWWGFAGCWHGWHGWHRCPGVWWSLAMGIAAIEVAVLDTWKMMKHCQAMEMLSDKHLARFSDRLGRRNLESGIEQLRLGAGTFLRKSQRISRKPSNVRIYHIDNNIVHYSENLPIIKHIKIIQNGMSCNK